MSHNLFRYLYVYSFQIILSEYITTKLECIVNETQIRN
jgi:hypothetical protein